MIKKVIIVAIVVVVFIAVIGSASNRSTDTNTAQQTPIIEISTTPSKSSAINADIEDDKIDNVQPTQTPQPEYQIKYRDENSRVENYEILIKLGADGEAAALDIKKQCSKPCNIFVYDEAGAQQLEREYDAISDGESATAWKQQNYVYVADHLVGNIDFETDEWNAYPYRDFYYRQLGGKK